MSFFIHLHLSYNHVFARGVGWPRTRSVFCVPFLVLTIRSELWGHRPVPMLLDIKLLTDGHSDKASDRVKFLTQCPVHSNAQ